MYSITLIVYILQKDGSKSWNFNLKKDKVAKNYSHWLFSRGICNPVCSSDIPERDKWQVRCGCGESSDNRLSGRGSTPGVALV